MRGSERENAAMIPVLSMILKSSPLHTEVLQTHIQLGGENEPLSFGVVFTEFASAPLAELVWLTIRLIYTTPARPRPHAIPCHTLDEDALASLKNVLHTIDDVQLNTSSHSNRLFLWS